VTTILIAGGGTGGHVFPGLAVADALRAVADVDVVFCGTPRGLEARVIEPRGYRLEVLDVVPMKGGGASRAAKGAAIAARETARALALVGRIAPAAVLSMGGYAAGPVALAAALRRVPLAVLEPNSAIGFANKVLSRLCARAYVAWPEVAAQFRPGVARVFGVPLRAGFAPSPYVPRATKRVLVLGGSQGAAPLNERVPATIARLLVEVPDVEVLHQAGRDRDAAVRARYEALGITRAHVVPFVEDVGEEIARADLVLARSGAVTVAELAAIGRAAVLVPFPQAADDHQYKNAASLAAAGGAVCIRQEAADDVRLARELAALLCDDASRARMAAASRAHGRPGASLDVARDLLGLAGLDARATFAPGDGGGAGGGGAHETNGAGARSVRAFFARAIAGGRALGAPEAH
jgi:UDP-N-acetylglucosamine--N-acetylmuramyl-(pentapeptide) pyrophosphoryl-undecaprenol N-acetylglucosamine transferase